MSNNPFQVDQRIAVRIEALEQSSGTAVRAYVAQALSTTQDRIAENLGCVLTAKQATEICDAHSISSDELMLLSLGKARDFAHPPISEFYVGCVGREAGSGNLVFGGNLEFVGAHIGNTVHGEGFVLTRSFSRGTAIETLAIGEAHPCAHCRQYLSEFAATASMTVMDPLGHRLKMADLYPWPFDPNYLGEKGIVAGEVRYPSLELKLSGDPVSPAVAGKLTELGRRSYTPYGKSPAAIVLTLKDDRLIGGSAIESVAFNPTISPIQAAMIDLFAHGYVATDIAAAAAATAEEALVDYVLHAADTLAVVAPAVVLSVVKWA
ncbi:MAG: cytidine deaminase [Devosia sp.]